MLYARGADALQKQPAKPVFMRGLKISTISTISTISQPAPALSGRGYDKINTASNLLYRKSNYKQDSIHRKDIITA